MEDFDLIDYAVPSGGIYCVVGMRNNNQEVEPHFTKDRKELDGYIADLVERKFNVYITLGKLVKERRKAENVESFASIWVDLDCGEGKATPNEKTGIPEGYASQEDASIALFNFCELVELPRPALVNSGNGLHAYWGFTEEVPKDKWLALATRLKALCVTQKFYADPNVYDAARIMRLPNTFNYKSDPPKEASVWIPNKNRYDFQELCDLLGVTKEDAIVPVKKTGRIMDALDKEKAQNEEYSFKRIVTREDGCLQLQDSIRNRATLAEPRWYDALAVAKFCNDRDKAIEVVSLDHPDYDPDAVERKLTPIAAPHTCKQFEANNPKGCDECPHKKNSKIKTPWSLGKIVREAVDHKYPEPYFRGEHGGIYKRVEDSDPVFVYNYDFYLKDRLRDHENKYTCFFELHTPHDGIQEFTIANSNLGRRDLLRELAANGVVPHTKKTDLLVEYVIESINLLQAKRKAEIMRVQFGWADNDTKFIVGEREITVDAVYHTPASAATAGLAPHFVPKGTLEKWQEVFNMYNREGLEIQAFAALSGFGAPLLKFTGQKGAIINLIHQNAGTGKTTVLRMANSVCGDPEHLLGNPGDSPPGRINKLGFLNNIVNTMDEWTDKTGAELGEYAYACSQGKGREKASFTQNVNRKNFITWRTITVTTSNASFYQKLRTQKVAPQGELMRILEFVVDYQDKSIVSTDEGRNMFDHQLNANYGHAIVPFIQFVIANIDHVTEHLYQMQNMIDTTLGLTQRERNWSAIIAANITGGYFANKLGLIDFNMRRIYHKVTPVILRMREETLAPVDVGSAVIADFISAHHANMLTIKSTADLRNSRNTKDFKHPNGPLLIRYESDTKMVALKVSKLREYFTKTQTDYKSVINELKSSGMYIAVKNVRLGKGAPGASGLERCLVLDGNHPDFVGADQPMDEEDEDRESGVPDKLEEV